LGCKKQVQKQARKRTVNVSFASSQSVKNFPGDLSMGKLGTLNAIVLYGSAAISTYLELAEFKKLKKRTTQNHSTVKRGG
jgi:hypothetical protein